MKVAEWIAGHPGLPVTVAPEATLDELVERLVETPGVRDLYVVEGGRVIGHLSHRRLAHLLLAEHRPVHTRRQLMERVVGGTARELMNVHFPHVPPEEALVNVLHRALELDVEDLAVVDADHRLLGRVNLSAVLRDYRGLLEEG